MSDIRVHLLDCGIKVGLSNTKPGSQEPAGGAEGPRGTAIATAMWQRQWEGERHHIEGEEEEGSGAEEEKQPFLTTAGSGP